MTKRELIERLAEYPDDMDVTMCSEDGYHTRPVHDVRHEQHQYGLALVPLPPITDEIVLSTGTEGL